MAVEAKPNTDSRITEHNIANRHQRGFDAAVVIVHASWSGSAGVPSAAQRRTSEEGSRWSPQLLLVPDHEVIDVDREIAAAEPVDHRPRELNENDSRGAVIVVVGAVV